MASLVVLVGHSGLMWIQALTLAQFGSGQTNWHDLIKGTHIGQVWLIRVYPAALLLLGSCLALTRWTVQARWACAVLSAAYLALIPWGGHAAAAETLWMVMVPNILHILAMSIWLGALPSWLLSVRSYARKDASALSGPVLTLALQRFSRLSVVMMTVIVSSGLWLADFYLENEGDLLGTAYGGLLLAKVSLLALALFFANKLRTRFLPELASSNRDSVRTSRADAAVQHVGVELAAALAVVMCAAWLAQTTPALHESTPYWWLPFRWSIEATWSDSALRPWILGSIAALTAAVGIAAGLRRTHAVYLAALLAGMALTVLAWALAVPAYPDTFRRSQVPYLTLSVSSGRELFNEHCVSCHGSGGLGDGVLAKNLPVPPANLSEPHTALHTAGDMHWWLSQGIPESGMPGLASVLSEDDRWDLINFLRAFSQGFESRVLRASVVPNQAWLGAINFYIEGDKGPSELKAYRDSHNVLLVFLGGKEAADRAQRLASAYPEIQSKRTQILAVPLGDSLLPADLPFPVLKSGAADIWAAYELLTRTIGDRGSPDRLDMNWTHAEFLIDRFGYLRARWIAQDDDVGWSVVENLYPELQLLNDEPRLRPPPDDHIH